MYAESNWSTQWQGVQPDFFAINGWEVQDGNGFEEDTVKIPGSDQYKPPEAFREDILDAMKKEKAPEAFKDQVKRYYEELTR